METEKTINDVRTLLINFLFTNKAAHLENDMSVQDTLQEIWFNPECANMNYTEAIGRMLLLFGPCCNTAYIKFDNESIKIRKRIRKTWNDVYSDISKIIVNAS